MPKSDTISDRKGLSSAVKNEEKHISIHPTIYEKANEYCDYLGFELIERPSH